MVSLASPSEVTVYFPNPVTTFLPYFGFVYTPWSILERSELELEHTLVTLLARKCFDYDLICVDYVGEALNVRIQKFPHYLLILK